MSSVSFYKSVQRPISAEAPWATREEMGCFAPVRPEQGIILADNATLAMQDEVDWQYSTNRNVAVVGGSGSGKTRSFVMPNLVSHLDVNYVITDTKRELYRACAEGFARDGYEVIRFDTVEPSHSCRFDPLAYIRTEEDINRIATLVLDAIDPARNSSRNNENDAFWVQSSNMLFRAVIGLLWQLELDYGALSSEGPAGEPYKYLCMNRVLELLDLIKSPDEWGDAAPSPLDHIFDALAKGGADGGPMARLGFELKPRPTCYAVRQYQDFKQAACRTIASIIISLNACLSQLKTPEIMKMMSGDDLRLDQIDEGKRVIYLVMSDNESSRSCLGRMLFQLLLNRALTKADGNPTGALERPVTFMCDEFANLGPLPNFERVISIARSRRINFLLCVQSVSQLRFVYGKEVATIILDNCDAAVFMGGGSSYESAEYFSKLCGTSQLGTELIGVERTEHAIEGNVMSPSAIARMPRDRCIVRIAGCKPFYTTKYDVLRHPNAERFLALQ